MKQGKAVDARATAIAPKGQGDSQLVDSEDRGKRIPKPPRMKVVEKEDGSISIAFDEKDETAAAKQLVQSLGDGESSFVASMMNELINGTKVGSTPKSSDLNYALQIVGAVRPTNELEAILASQMAVVHMAAMRHVRMMNNVNLIPQLEVQEKTVSRVMRTFAMQMEALRKYRSGGEQRVIVKHVTVNDGGQAIVGNVSTTGGRDGQKN